MQSITDHLRIQKVWTIQIQNKFINQIPTVHINIRNFSIAMQKKVQLIFINTIFLLYNLLILVTFCFQKPHCQSVFEIGDGIIDVPRLSWTLETPIAIDLNYLVYLRSAQT